MRGKPVTFPVFRTLYSRFALRAAKAQRLMLTVPGFPLALRP